MVASVRRFAQCFQSAASPVIGCWPPPTLGLACFASIACAVCPSAPQGGSLRTALQNNTIPWQPNGHTLNAQLEQARILMQDNQTAPSDVFVDLDYRGLDGDNLTVAIEHRGKFRRSASDKRMLKRRQAIEPIIGHLKQDHRMDRCHLKGETGDRLHAVLCAAGYNLKWLLRMIAKKGVNFWKHLFCA
jgi:hypothetical protein